MVRPGGGATVIRWLGLRGAPAAAVLGGVLLVGLAACGQAPGAAAPSSRAAASSERRDAAGVVWLCRPGLADDPCDASLSTTVLSGGTGRRIVDYQPARHPAIDCFYVYPLVTAQTSANANLDIDPQETAIAELEASPFAQDCRVFAPMYREATLGAVNSAQAENVAYDSVVAAWKDYLAHYNDGRGVVLIGHSEGADQLARLVAEQIGDAPGVRRRIVSAILTGANLVVGPNGSGPFSTIRACRSDAQTGCVIAYNAFSGSPPAGALFGTPNAGRRDDVELCTNPAALGGGTGRLVSMYRLLLPTQDVAGSLGFGFGILDPPAVSTPWVEFVQDYAGRCVRGADGTDVLIVSSVTSAAPALTPVPDAAWGLHVDDPNLALGNLVGIVEQEARAYQSGR
jgi:hypothetical protein